MFKHDIVLPWKIDPALSSIFFLHLGYVSARYNLVEKAGEMKNIVLLPLMLLCLAISYYFSMMNLRTSGIIKVNIIHNIVGDYLPFTLTGLFVLFWYFMACFKIYSFAPVISFYGRNSMVILGTHYSIMHLIKNALKGRMDVTGIAFNVGLSIFLMILSLPLISLAKKYVPQFTGYDKLIKPRVNAGVQV